MIKSDSFLVAAAVTALSLLGALSATAQGSLTPPPGPSAPVMKTLDQIEARTPVNTLPGTSNAVYVISKPGSYYFTGPIAVGQGMDGIRIETNNVTIDMNGFTLSGTGSNGYAVSFLSKPSGYYTNFVLRNGHIDLWGQGGVAGRAEGALLENIHISNVKGGGISIGAGSVVRDCSVRNVRHYGISGNSAQIVSGCSVEGVTGTYGQDVRGIEGIKVVENCSVRDVAGSVSTAGAHAGINANIVRNAVVWNVSMSGVDAVLYGIVANVVENCRLYSISATQGYCYAISADVVRGSSVNYTLARQAIGIYSDVVSGSTVENTSTTGTYAVGIDGRNVTQCRVTDCSGGTNYAGFGINVGYGGLAENCSVAETSGHGIVAGESGVVLNCNVREAGSSSVGILATDDGARIEGNNVLSCGIGIKLGIAGSSALRNTARANILNYSIAAGSVGPVANAAAAATATNPFTNLSL